MGADGVWKIPIILRNLSSAAAEHTQISVELLNPDVCQIIRPETFIDVSHVNPGKRVFIAEVDTPIYRGLDKLVGELNVSLKEGELSKGTLNLSMTVYSSRMRARRWYMTVQLAKEGFSATKTGDEYLY